jgi:putative DNA methylase
VARRIDHIEIPGLPVFVAFRTRGRRLTPAARRCVVEAFRHFDGARYDLHQVVCMPDHVHVVLRLLGDTGREGWSLARVMHSVKSFTAHAINRLLGTRGPVWQKGYYSNVPRSQRDYETKLRYVIDNPARAGLVTGARPYEFAWNRWQDGQGASITRTHGAT